MNGTLTRNFKVTNLLNRELMLFSLHGPTLKTWDMKLSVTHSFKTFLLLHQVFYKCSRLELTLITDQQTSTKNTLLKSQALSQLLSKTFINSKNWHLSCQTLVPITSTEASKKNTTLLSWMLFSKLSKTTSHPTISTQSPRKPGESFSTPSKKP